VHGPADASVIDLAVIGAGAAGTFVAERTTRAHPEWSVAVFERTDRIGGRLRSLQVPGLEHPIELGGMRYLTSHRRVIEVVRRFDLATHPFDPTSGAQRSFLRGRFGRGPDDPTAGDGYALTDIERGRPAAELGVSAFDRIVPGATRLTAQDWAGVRANGRYRGRATIEWTLGEALASVLSPEGHRFVGDSFGYDSGLRAFNLADGIQYLVGGGDPTAAARVPDDGMDAIPRAMATAFVAAGGVVRLDHELVGLAIDGSGHRLRFANGVGVAARRVVLTVPVPALRQLATGARTLDGPAFGEILGSVEAFPAVKVYLWYDLPWWSDDGELHRMTTDLPPRKLYYFGADPERPAALLAAYTDGRHVEPWRELLGGSGPHGSPAPDRLLTEIQRYLRLLHPTLTDLPAPKGSAYSSWGADPHETGWSFWRAGAVSDDVIRRAIRPIPGSELFVCGEAFSRAQGWVEGALETAESVADLLDASG